MMGDITSIGRIGGFAVTLGIGAALVTSPWVAGVAAASPNTLHANSSADTNNTTHQQNMAISTGGEGRVQKGSAVAFSSGAGSVAEARGPETLASANGDHNHAIADGPGALAIAGGLPGEASTGVHDIAIVHASPDSLVRTSATVENGNSSSVIVNGTGDSVVSLGSNNKVTVNGDFNTVTNTG